VIHAIGPDQPVAEAARRMIRERIHRLVVVDGNFRVVGMLSALDLLRALDGVQPDSPVKPN
jgi:CBS domain-containing protein